MILTDWLTAPTFKIISVVLSGSQVKATSRARQHGQLVGQMERLRIDGTQFTPDSSHHLVFTYI